MNYYELLGVSPNASTEDIRRAYKLKAQVHHPDKEGGDEALFKQIQKAYEVLSDPERRQKYDLGQEDDNVPPIRNMAVQTLVGIFINAIDNHEQIESVDLIEVVTNSIHANTRETKRRKSQLDRTKLKYLRAQEKLKFKGESNFLNQALERSLGELQLAVQNMERQELINAEMILILQDYSFDLSELLVIGTPGSGGNPPPTSRTYHLSFM